MSSNGRATRGRVPTHPDGSAVDLQSNRSAEGPAWPVPVAGLAASHSGSPGRIQRTVVGRADDTEEIEADRVARSVLDSVHTSGAGMPALAPWAPAGRATTTPGVIGAAGGELDGESEHTLRDGPGHGSSIAPATRTVLEAALGADLSDVRLHAGPSAASLNQRLSAAAFTHGRDIYFRDGLPDTSTPRGLHLLAHEATHAVQQGTGAAHESADASASPPQPVRRKLLVDGNWYGKDEEAELRRLQAEQGLPDWTATQLGAERFYVLSDDRQAWVEDTTLMFYRHKPSDGHKRKAYLKQGAKGTQPGNAPALISPATQELKEPSRVGPKHPEQRTVTKVRLFKYKADEPGVSAGHWMLECDAEGGKTGTKKIKIDLMNDGYRIYYGVTRMEPTKFSEEMSFDLDAPVTVGTLYAEFVRIANEKGSAPARTSTTVRTSRWKC